MVDCRVIEFMSNRDYHASSALSSSQLRGFMKPGGPARFRAGSLGGPSAKSARVGSVAHAWCLESVKPKRGPEDCKTDTSVKFKQWIADEYKVTVPLNDKGKPDYSQVNPNIYDGWLLDEEYAQVEGMAGVFARSTRANELMGVGRAEVSVFWTDPDHNVVLRARPDWVPDSGPFLLDYKTSADGSPVEFAKSVARYGYHMQAAFYLRAAQEAGWDKTRFVFIVQEKEPPYNLAFYELSEEWLAAGEELVARGLESYAQCLSDNYWPGYAQNIVTLEPAPWQLNS